MATKTKSVRVSKAMMLRVMDLATIHCPNSFNPKIPCPADRQGAVGCPACRDAIRRAIIGLIHNAERRKG